jgi:hypothetical protein
MKETIYGSVARGHSHKVCVIYKVLPAEFVEGTFPPRNREWLREQDGEVQETISRRGSRSSKSGSRSISAEGRKRIAVAAKVR